MASGGAWRGMSLIGLPPARSARACDMGLCCSWPGARWRGRGRAYFEEAQPRCVLPPRHLDRRNVTGPDYARQTVPQLTLPSRDSTGLRALQNAQRKSNVKRACGSYYDPPELACQEPGTRISRKCHQVSSNAIQCSRATNGVEFA